ncbi:MAG: hypothetical protein LH609_01745 [Rudanella sp.]|nr:hypothetical protein [Rudanella sp.]
MDNSYTISTDKTRFDLSMIHQFLSQESYCRWMLITYDAHGLYSQFGFQPTTENPENTMFIKPFSTY